MSTSTVPLEASQSLLTAARRLLQRPRYGKVDVVDDLKGAVGRAASASGRYRHDARGRSKALLPSWQLPLFQADSPQIDNLSHKRLCSARLGSRPIVCISATAVERLADRGRSVGRRRSASRKTWFMEGLFGSLEVVID